MKGSPPGGSQSERDGKPCLVETQWEIQASGRPKVVNGVENGKLRLVSNMAVIGGKSGPEATTGGLNL